MLLADAAKFSGSGSVRVCAADALDVLVTDAPPPVDADVEVVLA